MSAKKKTSKKKPARPVVAIVMGSDSDFSVMKEAGMALKEFGIPFEAQVVSAHRTPQEMARFAGRAARRGIRVIIAGAGGAAHLPGMVAAFCDLPVIGVPVPHGPLQGQDALLSIVQMPRGVPVATVAIGSAFNAGILAAQIIACGGKTPDLRAWKKISSYKQALRRGVLAKKLPAL